MRHAACVDRRSIVQITPRKNVATYQAVSANRAQAVEISRNRETREGESAPRRQTKATIGMAKGRRIDNIMSDFHYST